MKVILLKAVPKVGKKDEIVEVNQGYAANALFPQRLAIPATEQAVEALNRRKQNVETDKQVRRNLLDRAISAVDGGKLNFKAPANDQGNLFSKIDEKDIAEFLVNEHRISIDPKCITLPEGPIKKIGMHEIHIKDGDYKATVKITVSKE